jgi:serine/threonine-protein kinase
VETLKKLRHANIVELYGFGEQDGHLFYSMELVEGHSLHDELESGRRFAWREVIRIGIDICAALKHAHDRGIVHRDLKPANLLLDAGERVKLADFGIAKLFGGARMTAEGGVVGTADYMAPEQAEGRPATTRSDLYSLGSVLYALLAGQSPFASKTLPEVIYRLCNEAPPPLERYVTGVPQELLDVISQLLEKDPQKRIGTVTAVAKRLAAMQQELVVEGDGGPKDSDGPKAGDAEPDYDFELSDDAAGAQRPVRGELGGAGPTLDLPCRDPAGVELAGGQLAGGQLAGGQLAGGQLPAVSKQEPTPTRTFAPTQSKAGDSSPDPPPQPMAAVSHFTTLDDDVRRRASHDRSPVAEEEEGSVWIKAAALILALAGVSLVLWYALRPPSADALYQQIVAAADEDDMQALMAIEDEIRHFIGRFTSDPRCDEVRTYGEQIDLYRLQRQFERRALLLSGPGSLSPVELIYLNATRMAETDPEAAAAKLQALIDVFGQQADVPEETRRCVQLARQQLQELNERIKQSSRQQLVAIEQRLAQAENLRDSDPVAAEAIWRGIIELYADKPWAEDVVRRAGDALETPVE